MSIPILDVRGLEVAFASPRSLSWQRSSAVRVIHDASFSIRRREIVGLVGESGCGKTTLSRALLRLLPSSAGSVIFDGIDVLKLSSSRLRALRGRMQLIFQDPYTSLNPRMTAGDIIGEGMILHGNKGSRHGMAHRVASLLGQVGLPIDAAARYPYEFSGGQRQRIGIARALATEPDFIIADEPVSALDMSIQAQILNLLMEQQERRGLSMLFIGHDLTVIRHICDRVMVMYRGNIVETAPVARLFDRPAHPYTRALIDAAPAARPHLRRRDLVAPDDSPNPAFAPDGCSFAARCKYVIEACRERRPLLEPVGDGHESACIRTDLLDPDSGSRLP